MSHYDRLDAYFQAKERVLIAFSGGVDSGLLAYVAHKALGDQVLAVTGVSPSVAERERLGAEAFCRGHGIPHHAIQTAEFDDPNYLANRGDRCYYCKHALFHALRRLAHDLHFPVIVEGTNCSDLQGHRPGHRAAEEAAIAVPYVELGFDKAAIRSVARHCGLDIAEKPAMACLSSRIPVGTTITVEQLSQVERAEAVLLGLGVQHVRIRHHDNMARIEVHPSVFARCVAMHDHIVTKLQQLGFQHVTLDLKGYRPSGDDGS